jgi:ParB/RepB/Spo0J family partition protein
MSNSIRAKSQALNDTTSLTNAIKAFRRAYKLKYGYDDDNRAIPAFVETASDVWLAAIERDPQTYGPIWQLAVAARRHWQRKIAAADRKEPPAAHDLSAAATGAADSAAPAASDAPPALPAPAIEAPTATRPINKIIIGERHRRDLGDIKGLAESIAEVGLLHPIVITPSGDLVAGGRRLAACKRLDWANVPVNVVDLTEIVRGEYAENAHRKDFLPSEIDAIRRAIEPIERAAAKANQRLGGRGKKGAQIAKPFRATEKIGAFAGVGARTVEKIAKVVQAAESEPERFGHLIQELDRYRGVDRAYRALHCARDEARVLGLQPRVGKSRTLVIDVPWEYDNDWLGRGAPQYALMKRDEALALPVASWAEDDSHIYVWATNANLPLAVECMAAWGFVHKAVLTWVKPAPFGLGKYFRGSTEHVLFGVRGSLMTRSTSIATHFEAPRGEHSEKPERFYEIVRAASYPPFGEAFQRKARPDFVNLFEPAPAAAEPVREAPRGRNTEAAS